MGAQHYGANVHSKHDTQKHQRSAVLERTKLLRLRVLCRQYKEMIWKRHDLVEHGVRKAWQIEGCYRKENRSGFTRRPPHAPDRQRQTGRG